MDVYVLILLVLQGVTSVEAFCAARVADIVFVMDASGSVGVNNFNKIKEFMKQTISEFEIGTDVTRVGVITFSSYAKIEFQLNTFNTSNDLSNAIDNIYYSGGGTNTGVALELLRSRGFANERVYGPNFAIVITDGKSWDRTATRRQALLAKQSDIIMIAIGVGSGIDLNELKDIASVDSNNNQSLIYEVSTFEDLQTLKKDVATVACGFCAAKVADIVFAMDASGSVGVNNFNKIKEFMKQTINEFEIGTDVTRVGVITFSSYAKIEFQLNTFNTVNDLSNAIDNIYYSGGGTNTGVALELLRSRGFANERVNGPNIAIVITDGKSWDRTATRRQAMLAKQSDIIIIAIGVGIGIDLNELKDIASVDSNDNQSLIYEVSTFEDLQTLKKDVATVACGYCPVPDEITNGNMSYTGRNQNKVVTYTCRHGHRLMDGTLTRTCQAGGSWDGTLPTCSDCPVPGDITNGKMTYTGLNRNDVVTYTCHNGYRLSGGTLTRTCQADSLWDGTLPTCTDIDSYFSFECYMNGTISAVNPDPTSLIWVEASNENGTCSSSFTSDNTSVIIEGCTFDNVILLVFSPFNTGIPSVIQNNVKYYNITCMNIPTDGVLVVVTDKSWVKNVMSTSKEPERTPKVYLNSEIVAVDSQIENKTSVLEPETPLAINEILRWTLNVPEQYIIQPLNCTAYSGTLDEFGFKFTLDIIQFGCSLDLDIVSDFRFIEANVKHIMVGDINVFRFPGSDVIEIVCSIKSCPQGSTSCDFTCPVRTKRRVTKQSSLTDCFEATSGSDDGERNPRAVENTIHRTARISFRVIGPPTVGLEYLYMFESSSQQITSWTLTVILSVIVGRLLRI